MAADESMNSIKNTSGSEHKKDTYPLVYACWDQNILSRKKASSGGIAGKLIAEFINQGGVIFAPAYNDSLVLAYKEYHHISDEYIGTKYVEAHLNDSFKKIDNILKTGGKVLFIGTPCVVHGLKKFTHDNPHLLLVDFVCSGTPSALVFDKYKKQLEIKYGSKVTDLKFKYKSTGWKSYSIFAKFENGGTYEKLAIEDEYMNYMLRYNVSVRPACYKCRYSNMDRKSDITLGDFWGYTSTSFRNFDTDQGISLCIINTDKGKNFFDNLENIFIEKRSITQAVNNNYRLHAHTPEPINRPLFWKYLISDDERLHTEFPAEDISKGKFKYTRAYRLIENTARFIAYKLTCSRQQEEEKYNEL